MSIEQFNKTITSINMINSINRNLGIDNASSSSKIKMIADTLTDEIFNTNQNTQELLSRKYTSTAAGKYLDMNGAEYGVYRTKVSSVSILKNEGTAVVGPINPALGFESLMLGQEIISQGEKFEIDGAFIVEFIDSVIVLDKYTPVSAYVKIKPISEVTSVDIAKDSLYELSNYSNPYSRLITLSFSKPVSFVVAEIDDDTYRLRIELSKNLYSTTSEEYIRSLAASLPVSSDIIIKTNENGTGTCYVYLLTETQKLTGADPLYSNTAEYILRMIESNLHGGIDYKVATPSQLQLRLNVTNKLDSLGESVVRNIVLNIFNEYYSYSKGQKVSVDALNALIAAKYEYGNLITVDYISVYDTALSGFIFVNEVEVEIPDEYYLYLPVGDIEVNQ